MWRITPAYAGKSANSEPITLDVEDHPRLCGEKCKLGADNTRCGGSPPPMRGKGKILLFLSRSARITPAYAGKRNSTGVPITSSGDHPRLCGEKIFFTSLFFILTGSPPPMRGKVKTIYEFANGGRDHPRLCGEKAVSSLLTLFVQGSPPPMRGKDEENAVIGSCNGITPAYAGKSCLYP